MARIRQGHNSRRCNCQSRTQCLTCRSHPYAEGARKVRRIATPASLPVIYRNTTDFFDAFEAQLVLGEEAQSPDSTFSRVSRDDVSVSSSSISTTADLGRRRLYTPLDLTPSSSEGSTPEYLNYNFNYQQEPYVYYPDQAQLQPWNTFGGGQTCLSPIQHTPIDLVGIAGSPSYEEAATFVQDRVEFVSPHGPTPTSHQRYPQSIEPWTGHPHRHEDPMILDQNLDPVPTAPSPTSSSGEKGGRRTGPLTNDQRRRANAVRTRGACLRCSYMKETCDVESDQCRNCHQKKGRKWKLGCIRKKLYEQAEYFFPVALRHRYAAMTVNQYSEKHAFFYKSHRQPFILKLDMRLPGRPLEVLVREVEIVEPMRQNSYGFKASSNSTEVLTEPVWSPPVMLYLENQDDHIQRIRAQLNRWMRNVFQTQKDVVFPASAWPWPCFPSTANDFEGDIAVQVFKYWRPELPSHEILRKAQSLLFFGYILDHPFMVSGAALDELLGNLQYPPPKNSFEKGNVSPDTITRFIRMLILPLAMEVAKSVLQELHELLHSIATSKEVSIAKTDTAFCLSFTLLVFLAYSQSRELLVSSLPEHERGTGMDPDQTFGVIREMENELATYIIHFHEFAIRRPKNITASPGSSDERERHAAKFGLMKEIEKIAVEYKETRPPGAFKLRRPDIKKFDVENVHRLCWKFINALGIGVAAG